MRVVSGITTDSVFDTFANNVRRRFSAAGSELFRTNLPERALWDAFLNNLPEDQRQYYTCHCCRRFFEQYADIGTINAQGEFISALWDIDSTPEKYRPSVEAILKILAKSKVRDVFASDSRELGQAEAGGWTHLSVTSPTVTRSPFGFIISKRNAMENVSRALGELNIDALQAAVTILESDMLYRSEKVLGAAQWLLTLAKNRNRNLLWRAVAAAPEGFCHPRSSMIWTLLEDLTAGYSVEVAAKRFKAKMHPLQYQRPQAAPSAGTIAAAEKKFAELGAASALRRRYLKSDEIQHWLWQPSEVAKKTPAGIFSHLKPTTNTLASLQLDGGKITWEKFAQKVLPEAKRIRAVLPYQRMNFYVFTTAADPDCVPMLQWDNPERRNPVSVYTWHGGSLYSDFWFSQTTPVIGVCPYPEFWGLDSAPSQFMLCLQGGYERKAGGLAIFPESLKAEYRDVRSVIEAHSKSGTIEGMSEGPHAIALPITKSMPPLKLLVTTDAAEYTYVVDRIE